MAYEIKAYKSPQGIVRLRYDTQNRGDAILRAEAEGYRVLSARSLDWHIFESRGRRFPLPLFSQELLSLLDAGLPLLEAIDTLSQKEQHPQAKAILAGLTRRLKDGWALSSAMQEREEVFPAMYIASVRASERTGDLKHALERYLVYNARIESVRKKLINALIYPALLMTVGGLVIFFLLVFVIPRFSLVYEDLGNELPFLTRLLMEWGRLFRAYTFEIALLTMLVLGVLIYSFSRAKVRSRILQRLWDIPSVGERLRLYMLARMYRTMGMLLRGGIPLVTALDMASGLFSQQHMKASMGAARQRISEGQPISESLLKEGLTTEVAYRMLRVGERSGSIGEMMERIAGFYDEEMARWADWFARMFEPILMIIIGFVIGGIVLLMYMPIFELAGGIQ